MRAPAPPPLPVPSLLTPPTDLHPFPGPSPAFVAVLLLLGLLLLLTPVLADESATPPGWITLPEVRHSVPVDERDGVHRITAMLISWPHASPPRVRVKGLDMDLDTFLQFMKPEADRSCGRGRARGAVFLVADGDTPWGCIQPIVDACADAPGDIDRIEFAVRSDASPERRVP